MSDHKKHFREIRESEYLKRIFEKHLLKIQSDSQKSKKSLLAGPFNDCYHEWHTTNSYHHMWQATLLDKFYDITIMVRLGIVIESCLKDYYQEQCGLSNRKELQEHMNSTQNIFQQLQPWHKNGIFVKINNEFHINPLEIDEVKTIQQVVLLRHFYAHNSGLLDQQFVNNYQRLTGIDICKAESLYPGLFTDNKNRKTIYSDYESEDIYFFEPLKKIQALISDSEKFFDRLYQL